MKRNGVTLLEVLFAIVIATVGILGVLVTLVIAGKQASDGARMDGADRLGRNAIREFEVRGFNRARGPQGTWAAVPIDGHAYCLDPLYVAANGTASPAAWFPAYDLVVVPGARMHRVSVRRFPGNQLFAPLPTIGLPLAESIFAAKDDLVFSLPSDRTLPPVQHYGTGAEARSFNGAFSWFATVQGASYSGGTALLSIAVCHRRNLYDQSERLVNVERIDDENPSLSVTGDISQRGREWKIAVRPGQSAKDLDAREGGWVLITGIVGGRVLFHWHRILSVDSILPAGNPDMFGVVSSEDTRSISTSGRAWPLLPSQTQAVLFDSVVAVYEKTIKMQE